MISPTGFVHITKKDREIRKRGITGKPCVRKWSGIDATEPEKEVVDVI